jgi:hypothetical protein
MFADLYDYSNFTQRSGQNVVLVLMRLTERSYKNSVFLEGITFVPRLRDLAFKAYYELKFDKMTRRARNNVRFESEEGVLSNLRKFCITPRTVVRDSEFDHFELVPNYDVYLPRDVRFQDQHSFRIDWSLILSDVIRPDQVQSYCRFRGAEFMNLPQAQLVVANVLARFMYCFSSYDRDMEKCMRALVTKQVEQKSIYPTAEHAHLAFLLHITAERVFYLAGVDVFLRAFFSAVNYVCQSLIPERINVRSIIAHLMDYGTRTRSRVTRCWTDIHAERYGKLAEMSPKIRQRVIMMQNDARAGKRFLEHPKFNYMNVQLQKNCQDVLVGPSLATTRLFRVSRLFLRVHSEDA